MFEKSLYFQRFYLHTHALDARLALLYALYKAVNYQVSHHFFKTCDSRMVFCNSFLHKSCLVIVPSQDKRRTVLQRVRTYVHCSLWLLSPVPQFRRAGLHTHSWWVTFEEFQKILSLMNSFHFSIKFTIQ